MASDWEALGGEVGVRTITQAFMDRVFDDFVIGFLFEGRDKARIVQREVELASAHLGGPLAYRGRGMGAVHQPLRINAGQFRRRLAILRHVLEAHGVDDAVAGRWIAHQAAMERVITDGSDCVGQPDDS